MDLGGRGAMGKLIGVSAVAVLATRLPPASSVPEPAGAERGGGLRDREFPWARQGHR
jgi:hypothetical protein